MLKICLLQKYGNVEIYCRQFYEIELMVHFFLQKYAKTDNMSFFDMK